MGGGLEAIVQVGAGEEGLGGLLAVEADDTGMEAGQLGAHRGDVEGVGGQLVVHAGFKLGHIGQADAEVGQKGKFGGGQLARGQARGGQHPPELVPRAGIVRPDGRRFRSSGSSAENQPEPRPKHIRKLVLIVHGFPCLRAPLSGRQHCWLSPKSITAGMNIKRRWRKNRPGARLMVFYREAADHVKMGLLYLKRSEFSTRRVLNFLVPCS